MAGSEWVRGVRAVSLWTGALRAKVRWSPWVLSCCNATEPLVLLVWASAARAYPTCSAASVSRSKSKSINMAVDCPSLPSSHPPTTPAAMAARSAALRR